MERLFNYNFSQNGKGKKYFEIKLLLTYRSFYGIYLLLSVIKLVYDMQRFLNFPTKNCGYYGATLVY